MKTISVDTKSFAIGLLFGLLMISLVGAVGSAQTKGTQAKYQMEVIDAKNGMVINTQTGELTTFQLHYPYDGELQSQVLHVLWRGHGETTARRSRAPR